MAAAEQKLTEILNSYAQQQDTITNDDSFQQWFLAQFKGSGDCNLEDFAVYFLNAIRQQTENFLKPQESSDSSRGQTPVRNFKALVEHTKVEQTEEQVYNTELTDTSLEISNLSNTQSHNLTQSIEKCTSTPVRHSVHHSNHRRSCQSQGSVDRASTRNNSASSSLCLGDFLFTNNSVHTRPIKKKTPLQQSNATDTPVTSKPRKRVVPTTISTRPTSHNASNGSTPFGGCSSFSNENNILTISQTEVDDQSKCAILLARKSLKLNASEISKQLQVSTPTSSKDTLHFASTPNSNVIPIEHKPVEKQIEETIEMLPKVDLNIAMHMDVLNTLARIHTVLINVNLTTNILNEISFLMNLLNATDQTNGLHSLNLLADNATGIRTLSSATNCVYFALCVLAHHQHTLSLLDTKSLGVVLNNERIRYLDVDLKTHLEMVLQQKQQWEKHKQLRNNSLRFGISFKNVYYREEDDARHNFPTNNDFAAFKAQRDLFYKSLKLWEENHLNSTWKFANDVSPKIREIFKRSESPINMAHFAKLFVSQLLISATDTSSPEEIGVEIDLQKLNKLTQRLVAPSNFSVDYQFPRNQAFFRDFINEARSVAFAAQLKMSLYQELITLNDSTFEEIKLNDAADKDDEDIANHQNNAYGELVVCPEILASMLLLAKFLGYTSAHPYNQTVNGQIAANIEKKQLVLRSLFETDFNVCQLLYEAINRRKLLITLPWLVQYFAMLDNITLQLEKFKNAIQILFEIYVNFVANKTTLLPSSVFIVRCCLGWLFEVKPIIARQYYDYRLTQAQAQAQNANNEYVSELKTLLCNYLAPQSTVAISLPNSEDANALNTQLESLLNVACPFLAEFRVSIMPARYSTAKYLSRTGRYRHITTRLAELPTSQCASPTVETAKDAQTIVGNREEHQHKLMEAFLHSQNPSMRRLIEFIMERVYKSVVKDAQYQILIPSKAAADARVNAIDSVHVPTVRQSVQEIYEGAREAAIARWHQEVPQLLGARIDKALDALLPAETAPIIKQTYAQLIMRNAGQRVHQWQRAHMAKNNNFYCSDLEELSQKICKANRKEKPESTSTHSSELILVKETPSVSDLLDELQYWLHCTSLRPSLFTSNRGVIDLLQRIPLVFENILPTVFYRLIGAGCVQLLQHIINTHPEQLTHELLKVACDMLLCSAMEKANSIGNKSQSNSEGSGDAESTDSELKTNQTCFLDGLVTVSFIESLRGERDRFDKLKMLLITFIKRYVITVDFVNILFVPIFKHNWHPQELNEISNMLEAIARETVLVQNIGGGYEGSVKDERERNDNDSKSHLFMKVLAGLTRDVEDF